MVIRANHSPTDFIARYATSFSGFNRQRSPPWLVLPTLLVTASLRLLASGLGFVGCVWSWIAWWDVLRIDQFPGVVASAAVIPDGGSGAGDLALLADEPIRRAAGGSEYQARRFAHPSCHRHLSGANEPSLPVARVLTCTQ